MMGAVRAAMPDDAWWLCPNDPRCGHGRILHDGDGWDEPYTCCVEGCTCTAPPVTDREAGRDA